MSYKDLQTKLGFNFKDKELLELAFTHKSYSNSQNNERLEFLGDSILNSVISKYLFDRFDNEKEGLLTRMRAFLVKAETLITKAEELSLDKYIKLSKGTANLSKERKNSILEDAFEALIGAIFIDGGWDIANEVILSIFNKDLKSLSSEMNFKDAKTELQELFQSMKYELPKYNTKEIEGGEFTCLVSYNGLTFEAKGNSKRAAETNVAIKLLSQIKSTSNE